MGMIVRNFGEQPMNSVIYLLPGEVARAYNPELEVFINRRRHETLEKVVARLREENRDLKDIVKQLAWDSTAADTVVTIKDGERGHHIELGKRPELNVDISSCANRASARDVRVWKVKPDPDKEVLDKLRKVIPGADANTLKDLRDAGVLAAA